MPGVFISYRGIARSYAPMLVDRELRRRFGDEHVFEAGRSIRPGDGFPESIRTYIRDCSLLVIVVDQGWIDDQHLLFRPSDWVRQEIECAVHNDRPMLPLLLDGVGVPKKSELPPEIAVFTTRIGLRMSAPTAAADLVRLVGEVERLAPDLVLRTLTDRRPPVPARPGDLLRPEYAVFPERSRAEEQPLLAWCREPDEHPVRLVTGPLGAGRTRLALMLVARLTAESWAAGVLSATAQPAALARLNEITTRTLVVIDDAETRPDVVRAAMKALATATGPLVRVLLVARTDGGWLDRLRVDGDADVAGIAHGVQTVAVAPLPAHDGDFDIALREFARWWETPIPAGPPLILPTTTLLETQAAALAHLLRPSDPDGSPMRRIAELERDHWLRAAQGMGLGSLVERNITEIMTAVTLFGADTEPEADALLGALRTFRGKPLDGVDTCRDLVRMLLPGPAALNPLQPEHLQMEIVTAHLLGGRSMADVVAAVTDAQALRALVLLGRCLDRSPQLIAPVTALVMADPMRLLTLAAIAVAAVPEPAPLVGIMSEAATRAEGLDLQRLVDDLPQRSEVLARFAVVVTERLRTSPSAAADAVTTARTARLLATRLAYLGERLDEAIELAREAVEVIDTVAERGPSIVAERAEASAVLANVLGDGEESIIAGARAVAGFESLPRGEYRYAGALATALHNQSVRLRAADRLEEAYGLAERAADLTAALHAERPALFLSLDADAQDLLAQALADTRRIEQAERTARAALAARRTLAAARPDAYRPQLAATLYNLSVICGRRGKAGESSGLRRESESLYSELDARWPGRFSGQLARIRERRSVVPDG